MNGKICINKRQGEKFIRENVDEMIETKREGNKLKDEILKREKLTQIKTRTISETIKQSTFPAFCTVIVLSVHLLSLLSLLVLLLIDR